MSHHLQHNPLNNNGSNTNHHHQHHLNHLNHSPLNHHSSSLNHHNSLNQTSHHHQQLQIHNLQQHLASKQQHEQHNTTSNNSSNASTPNSTNTSFLIKDILRYEGQKRKQRKARTAFSDHQLRELESSFEAKKYLTVQDRVELAAKLKLSDTQVKTWYQNRRTKHKRQTAVGYELLQEASHLYAYQSVLQSQTNWMFSNCAPQNPQFNLAAAAALLAAQASVQSGSLGAAAHQQQQQQLNNNNNVNNLIQQQQQQIDPTTSSSAANSSSSPTSPHSPQDQRLSSDHKC